jgi:hypothetical protein
MPLLVESLAGYCMVSDECMCSAHDRAHVRSHVHTCSWHDSAPYSRSSKVILFRMKFAVKMALLVLFTAHINQSDMASTSEL